MLVLMPATARSPHFTKRRCLELGAALLNGVQRLVLTGSSVIGLTFVSVLMFAEPSWADKGNGNKNQKQDERREDEAVRKAQKDVAQAQQSLNAAEKVLRHAQDEHRQAERNQAKASRHIEQTREELEKRHGQATGLFDARKESDSARHAYEKAGAPILTALRETPKYKEAVTAAKEADKQATAVRDDTTLEAEQRLKRLAEITRQKLVPQKLEREALDAETSLNDERSALKKAEAAVAKAYAETEKLVEKDPELKSARQEFERAKDATASAKKVVDKELRDVAEAARKLKAEQLTLQQKINADRKDDNRPNNKKKK